MCLNITKKICIIIYSQFWYIERLFGVHNIMVRTCRGLGNGNGNQHAEPRRTIERELEVVPAIEPITMPGFHAMIRANVE